MRFLKSLPTKMKPQLIITFVFILMLAGCSSKQHLSFNDIPIDGKLDIFAEKMVKSGFTDLKRITENQVQLTGKFQENDCTIDVFGAGKSRLTYKVIVSLPGEDHDSLSYSCEKLRKLYAAEYGNPKNVFKQFQNSSRFLFNERKFTRKLAIGDYSKFFTGSGFITLELRDGYIAIIYLDRLNYDIRKRELQPGNEYENNE